METSELPLLESIDIEQAQEYVLEPLLALFTAANLLQLGLSVATLFGALIIARKIEPHLSERLDHWLAMERHRVLRDSLSSIVFPFAWLLLQGLANAIGNKLQIETQLLSVVSVLLLAWIIIRLSTGLVSSRFWAKLIAVIAWTFAALSILGWLQPTIDYLDSMSFTLGKFNITMLSVLKAIMMVTLMLWLAVTSSRTIEQRLRKSRVLTPSMQELTSKLLKISFITLALLISVTSVGIDLTALAVFSGAVGVGIGFGLQKPASNLISGIILLMDRSIKPGDVIELGDTYGWVNMLGARFVSVITRDGKEHLIPNEDLITTQVINWSYSDTNVRLKIPVRIAYSSDVHKAMDLLVEAAIETPRVLESPAPRCLLMGFQDDGVQLELRIWTSDPNNGVANLKSAVLIKVWNKFHEHSIDLPFPQRDVHLDLGDDVMQLLLEVSGKKPRRTSAAKPKAKPATRNAGSRKNTAAKSKS